MLLKDYLFYYQKNLINLNSAISQANDELTIDGTIKSFELTYELVWKTMKRYLEVREINIHKI
jgi:predicted SprT family Zn-dependent metalloprotease